MANKNQFSFRYDRCSRRHLNARLAGKQPTALAEFTDSWVDHSNSTFVESWLGSTESNCARHTSLRYRFVGVGTRVCALRDGGASDFDR